MRKSIQKLPVYWKLIKSPQTGLLLATGLAGYMSARCPVFNLPALLAVMGSLFLAISGSTILNMWLDRDIDRKMHRTCYRPLATGQVIPANGLALGLAFSAAGIAWAIYMAPLYGGLVLGGWFFDVLVYSAWLKRRTCWSIIWGGVSGGMPILAGRAFALGELDLIGLAFAIAILFWIPTHIITFQVRYQADYESAGVPTFPAAFGVKGSRAFIAYSSLLAAGMMCLSGIGLGLHWGVMGMLLGLSAAMLALAVLSLLRPSERINFGLFKFASVYMLGSMVLMVI